LGDIAGTLADQDGAEGLHISAAPPARWLARAPGAPEDSGFFNPTIKCVTAVTSKSRAKQYLVVLARRWLSVIATREFLLFGHSDEFVSDGGTPCCSWRAAEPTCIDLRQYAALMLGRLENPEAAKDPGFGEGLLMSRSKRRQGPATRQLPRAGGSDIARAGLLTLSSSLVLCLSFEGLGRLMPIAPNQDKESYAHYHFLEF
jgi:hypothetical protein